MNNVSAIVDSMTIAKLEAQLAEARAERDTNQEELIHRNKRVDELLVEVEESMQVVRLQNEAITNLRAEVERLRERLAELGAEGPDWLTPTERMFMEANQSRALRAEERAERAEARLKELVGAGRAVVASADRSKVGRRMSVEPLVLLRLEAALAAVSTDERREDVEEEMLDICHPQTIPIRILAAKKKRFASGMNEDDHLPTCAILTTRDGWDADCTCGGLGRVKEKPNA